MLAVERKVAFNRGWEERALIKEDTSGFLVSSAHLFAGIASLLSVFCASGAECYFTPGTATKVAASMASSRPSGTPATTSIVVILPFDRNQWGSLTLVDSTGVALAGPFPVLGRSTGRDNSYRQVNPRLDPLKPFGNTPTGEYRIDGFAPTNNRRYDSKRFGKNFVIQMTPSSGEAKQAAAERGSTIRIHAGRGRSDGSLAWTQGCLRVHEETILELYDAVKLHNALPTSCQVLAVTVPNLDGLSHEARHSGKGWDPFETFKLLMPKPPVSIKRSTTLADSPACGGEMMLSSRPRLPQIRHLVRDISGSEAVEGVAKLARRSMDTAADLKVGAFWLEDYGGDHRFKTTPGIPGTVSLI